MPRITGPTQRVRSAGAQVRASGTALAANFMRANVAGVAPQQSTPPRPTAPAPDCCCKACVELRCLDRTRFFAGQLLTEADLNNEQSYWLAKGRLHNRFLHGWGVVCGLQVSCSDCEGWVTINPGYAIDPCGSDIIVCAGQSFNVIQAIQACCTPKKATDCSPLRYRPPTSCQDLTQTWCITIEYQDQPSRMVTPLQQSTASSSCECGCGGGCGCGCSGGKKNGNGNGCACGGSSKSSSSRSCVTSTATSSTAACEPTRIIEGFHLGVCQPPATDQNVRIPPPQPGTFTYQFEQCYVPLQTLIQQKPTLVDANNDPTNDQQAYQAVCQYLTSAKNALASAYITHCAIESALDNIQIPAPNGNNYNQLLQDKVTQIAGIIAQASLDCFCSALLPPCPPDPCDNRVVLACVTVQNGKIIDICHFGGGRRQVITFPALGYWLSIFGVDKALTNLGNFLESFCCAEQGERQRLFNNDVSLREAIATGGGNPAAINKALFSYVAQKLGASVVNAVSSQANAVDLRPLVGLNTDQALRALESYSVPISTITPIDVSSDPSWTDAAIAAAPAYAPAAFNARDPLTVYTRGKVVVGLEATSPTDALKNQVARLQQQVDALTTQIGGQRPGTTRKK